MGFSAGVSTAAGVVFLHSSWSVMSPICRCFQSGSTVRKSSSLVGALRYAAGGDMFGQTNLAPIAAQIAVTLVLTWQLARRDVPVAVIDRSDSPIEISR